MSDVIARPWRTNTVITPTISNDWFVEFKTFSEYTDPGRIERIINQPILKFNGNQIITANPDWESFRGQLTPVKECFVYIFRRTEGFTTLWDEIYIDDNGKIKKEYPPRNDRQEISCETDHLSIPLIEGNKRYTYYFWSSPFRLSALRIEDIRTIINKSSRAVLEKVFAIFDGLSLLEQCIDDVIPEGDLFTVFIPNYLGYASYLYNQIEIKLKDCTDFLNPEDETSKKIATFENILSSFIQKDDSLKNHIKNYETDISKHQFGERRKIETVSGIDKFEFIYRDPLTLDKINPTDAEEDFDYTDPASFVTWRHNRDLRKNYLQEQAEIAADILVTWMENPGFVFTLENLAFGSFNGSGTTQKTTSLPDEYDLEAVLDEICTNKSFDSKEGGDLLEALNGLLLKRLNVTDRGQLFIRNICQKAFNRGIGSKNNDLYSDYNNIISEKLSQEDFTLSDFFQIFKGCVQTTRAISHGLADIMEATSVHIITYALEVEETYRKQNRTPSLILDINGVPYGRLRSTKEVSTFTETILQTKKRVFEGRKVFFVLDDSNAQVTASFSLKGQRSRTSTLATPDGSGIQIDTLWDLSIEAEKGTFSGKLSNCINHFTNALDVINLGVGFLQILVLAGKENPEGKDALTVAQLSVDFASILPQFQTKVASRSLGAAGAAISAVTSGIDAYQQANEGDTDAAIMLRFSCGTSAASFVAYIFAAALVGTTAGAVFLVIAIAAGIISGIFSIISILLDDSVLELIVKNCFWGTEWTESSLDDPQKTPWSRGTVVSEWPTIPTDATGISWTGNLDAQLDSLTGVIFDYNITDGRFFELRANETTREPEIAGLICIDIDPKLLQDKTEIEVETILLREEDELYDTKFNFDLMPKGSTNRPEGNILYNFGKIIKTNYAALSSDESIERISFLIATKSTDRTNAIRTVLKDQINMPGWNRFQYNRAINSIMPLIMEPQNDSGSFDYYDKIQSYKSHDENSFMKSTSYLIRIKVSLYPDGKQGETPKIEKEIDINV